MTHPQPKYLWAFTLLFALICLIRKTEWVHQIDQMVYLFAVKISYSVLWLRFWHVITIMGSAKVMYAILLMGVLLLLRFEWSWRNSLFVVVLVCLCSSNILLKNYFAIERPVGLAPFYPEPNTYTFPSGHAFSSVLLFYLVPRFFLLTTGQYTHPERYRIYLSLPFVISGILLISLSRVFLGVHWLSDIVGGAFWGGLVSHFILWFFKSLKIGAGNNPP